MRTEQESRDQRALENFYDLMRFQAGGKLDAESLPTLTEVLNGKIPHKGIYFFFEPSETRSQKTELRVTRVGTHAVSEGAKSTLRSRLRTHAGTAALGGSHRSSIFRLHVGAALQSQSGTESLTWGVGSNADRIIKQAESNIEKVVSQTLREMRVVLVEVSDAASAHSDRAFIERNSIGLLSSASREFDPPTQNWLGNFSPRIEIRKSGMWNLNHLNSAFDLKFLETLKSWIDLPEGDQAFAPLDWRNSF